jgi:DNA-binding transcriptional regulator YiaG
MRLLLELHMAPSQKQPKLSPAAVANEVPPRLRTKTIKALESSRRKTDGRKTNRKARVASTSFGLCATFATAFHSWRLKRNIPLRKIAKDLGISIATVNSWESGQRFPTGRHLERIVDYTGVPPCRLLCRITHEHASAERPKAMPKKS